MKNFEVKEDLCTFGRKGGEKETVAYNNVEFEGSVVWKKDNPKDLETSEALALLIVNEDIFIHSDNGGIKLLVNRSDVFAWGCADAEPIEYKEIDDLFFNVLESRRWGALKWCCIKRNQQPQRPIIKDMKDEGVWDARLENLPENYYWAQIDKREVEKTENGK